MALNSFQSARDLVIRGALNRFKLSALFEILLGFVFATKSIQIAQTAEVECSGILTPRIDRFGQVLVRARRILREVGVNTQPVQLAEYSLLGTSRGGNKEGNASHKKSESPNHNNRAPTSRNGEPKPSEHTWLNCTGSPESLRRTSTVTPVKSAESRFPILATLWGFMLPNQRRSDYSPLIKSSCANANPNRADWEFQEIWAGFPDSRQVPHPAVWGIPKMPADNLRMGG